MRLILLILAVTLGMSAAARRVTVDVHNADAETVFKTLMQQSGKNFVYTSGLLDGMKISVHANHRPLRKVLDEMFRGTDIRYKIKGDNVMLSRRPARVRPLPPVAPRMQPDSVELPFELANQLAELKVTGSRLQNRTLESAEIGSYRLSPEKIMYTPQIFGESDVVKTLQLEPGVSAGTEGLAGLYVHGGNADENLYTLDNVPLYQVNHFAGLFSAFNVDVVKSVDFYKSSFPARLDGRLSSFVDVRTRGGGDDGHHGSARLGLTSGAFNISGPIGHGGTGYSVALRRSWYDVLTAPFLAINNALNDPVYDEDLRFRYAFTDFNAKITHRFSPRSNAHFMLYYGEDFLQGGSKDNSDSYKEDDNNKLRWGNLVASAGWNYRFSDGLSGEFTAAYTRYFSGLKRRWYYAEYVQGQMSSESLDVSDGHNNINDWIFRSDFYWNPAEAHRLNFGASYTFHNFRPTDSHHSITTDGIQAIVSDTTERYRANELNAYIGYDWRLSDSWQLNAGLHGSLFAIDSKVHGAASPRLALRYSPRPGWAFKAAYNRTVQYVHQLSQSYISLPTDQWVPITGNFKPQTADKISIGAYRCIGSDWTVSAEAYWKWMHNLVEYRTDYYLAPAWQTDRRFTSGDGSAKGVDFKLSKESGRISGHLGYSLLWADRHFAERNGGRPYPARNDNRHKINLLLQWQINDIWSMGASWTGMSGNRVTLPIQVWESPIISDWSADVPLDTDVNNYRLPFYHRLDLSFTRQTRRGYWTFSLYNAYCNMNVVAVRRDWRHECPRFQQLHLLPIIPSFSYTWIF